MNTEALEWGCLDTSVDRVLELDWDGGEVLTREPYVTSEAQSYGSADCSGFVVEITNPDGYNFNRVLVGGAGPVRQPSDSLVFGNSMLCSGLTLEADIYGYRNGVWDTLGLIRRDGRFEEAEDESQEDACLLAEEIVQPGIYEAVRVAGRVSNVVTTYPFRVSVN